MDSHPGGLPNGDYSEDSDRDYRVLSIQSHVVSGYVGNKSAVFPLQVLGFDVDFINTVEFSNHTGYGSWKGSCMDEKTLQDLFDGLRMNHLTMSYTHLLTGFVQSKTLLEKIADIARELKRSNPKLIYVCDPVMGDNGKMYVPMEVFEAYRDSILPLADIVTPNQFEAELLTGITIRSEKDALAAIDRLHSRGVPTVIISSSDLGDDKNLIGFGSAVNQGAGKLRFRMNIPRLPASFTGTGDLFTALLLAWMTKTGDLQRSCDITVSTLQAVLKRTWKHFQENCQDPQPCLRHLELRLIQSKRDIENPVVSRPMSQL
ncbi:Pyridoxal kinase [Hypsibius exemplaris]|uniref:Pyridoxal kinase n=1 Tax=Hypsibius exemplaris TaxID=2072580 RepID=A0A9X6N9Z7_HYPEX|nr:Pyridoxal kinase [Hypsibius exemplaris]